MVRISGHCGVPCRASLNWKDTNVMGGVNELVGRRRRASQLVILCIS